MITLYEGNKKIGEFHTDKALAELYFLIMSYDSKDKRQEGVNHRITIDMDVK